MSLQYPLSLTKRAKWSAYTIEDSAGNPIAYMVYPAGEAEGRALVQAANAYREMAPVITAYLEWRRLEGWALGADTHQAWNEVDAARLEFHRVMSGACTAVLALEKAKVTP